MARDTRPAESPPPVLDVRAPHWAARVTAGIVLGVFVAAVVAAVVIRLPETVAGPFVLVPVDGTDPVRASRGGVVGAVRVTEGQSVARDGSLVVIHSPAIGDRRSELRSLEAQLAGAGESLANTRRKYDSQRRAAGEEHTRLAQRLAHVAQKIAEQRNLRAVRERRYQAELSIAENEVEIAKKEIEFKGSQHRLAMEVADRSERLYTRGMVSWLEHSNRKLEAQKLGVDLQQLDRQLDSSRRRVSQLRTERERDAIEESLTSSQLETERSETRAAMERVRHESRGRDAEGSEAERRVAEDVEKARARVAALSDELSPSRGNEVLARAPCAGTIVRLHVKAAGAVVQAGDLLAELACAGARLQAEMTVPHDGVGRLERAQGVKLLYDAFPYQRHGVRAGTVRWVSPASVADRAESAFRAHVDIAEHAIVVKGQPQPLRAGMRGRAQVVVGRRSLLSYAFEPIHELREKVRDAPRW